eukprot:6180407-Pleurochrysis_carterae.AAC.2
MSSGTRLEDLPKPTECPPTNGQLRAVAPRHVARRAFRALHRVLRRFCQARSVRLRTRRWLRSCCAAATAHSSCSMPPTLARARAQPSGCAPTPAHSSTSSLDGFARKWRLARVAPGRMTYFLASTSC